MAASIPLLETLEITLSSTGVAELAFNRPTRFNAMSALAYKDWLTALQWAAKCDDVKITVITGRGKYYTSGQELTKPNPSPEAADYLVKRRKTSRAIIDELIDFPKVIIAAVNGPAIGFGVTSLALFDVVYSVPDATFVTPFMKLAFCAEGCSSVMFPRIMGLGKANEMLLMGRTFSAEELERCNFITRLIPKDNFRRDVLALAEEASQFSTGAIKVTKDLIRGVDREFLHQVNENEMKRLTERMSTQESKDSIQAFYDAKEKKAAAKRAKKNSKI